MAELRAAESVAIAAAAMKTTDGATEASTWRSVRESKGGGAQAPRGAGSELVALIALENELEESRAEVAKLRVSQMNILQNLQARDKEVKKLTAHLQSAILQNLAAAEADP